MITNVIDKFLNGKLQRLSYRNSFCFLLCCFVTLLPSSGLYSYDDGSRKYSNDILETGTSIETTFVEYVEDHSDKIILENSNPAMYCASSSGNSTYEYIGNVVLENINNNSGATNYSDFTAISTDLDAGESYSIVISPTWSGTKYNEGYGVWIDFNGDLDFEDAGEQIVSIAPNQNSTNTATFTVPNGAIAGSNRMRVSMKYNGIPSSCENTFPYGEVEDYTVNIISENFAEICDNGIDDDGDGLVDANDPDCSDLCALECANPYVFNWYDGSDGYQWPITNGEALVSNIYTISGDLGDYNVTVTLNNPDGQNIDFSNCTSIPDAAYTATCSDPNGNTECDGDPNTTDTQFTYGCSFLTFGITSDNSDQITSITYDFEYPVYLCDFEIGDIDFSPASNPALTSYQDEVDVVADSMGMPVVLSAITGSAVEVFNNNSSNIKLLADYDNVSGGDVLPTDPRGHANISSLTKMTSITFTYSNGPEDDGLSDDHAIRLAGFQFCPEPREICGNGIDDDGDGSTDEDDLECYDCQDGILVNPGFENELAPWDNYSGTATIEPESNGNNVAVISGGSGGIRQDVNIAAGDSISLSFYAKKSGSTSVSSGISFYDANNNLIGNEITENVVSNDYMKYELEAIAPANTAYVSVFALKDNATGSAFFDGFCLEAKTDPCYGIDPTITSSSDNTICIGSTIGLSTSTTGTWTSSDEDIATVSSSGAVTGVSAGTATITFVADANDCALSANIDITITNKQSVTITGDDTLCEGNTTTLSTSAGGGTWSSANTNIATINSSGTVTAVSTGIVLISYNHPSNSCSENSSFTIEVSDTPSVSITGDTEICVGETTSISTTVTGGFWTSSDSNIAIVSSSGSVSGIAPGTVTFYYTTGDDCTSEHTGSITVTPDVSVNIDFNGSECLTSDSQLSAMVTGGTSGYTYAWTGPDGFTGNAQTIDISLDGNYYVTVTDSKGCTDATTAFVYESYEPFIFALNTTVCEGDPVTLSVDGVSAAGYQWSASADNATSQSVTVTPSVPSSSYTVTVTNSIGCTTEATATIMVDPKPIVSISGSTDLCVGESSQLSPESGGEWTSANPNVATVTNEGVVTAVGNGSTSFTFKSNATGCFSDPTGNINVGANGTVTITGDSQICFSDTPTLNASVAGGTWSSADESIATIDVNGVITPQGQGTTTILYDVTSGGCYDDGSYTITINNDPSISINGSATICEGDNTFVNSSVSGTWSSSDESVATISNSGVITGVSGGTAIISLETSVGCTSSLNEPITVIDNPSVSLLGPAELCIDNTTTLSPSTGGVWISSNNNVASVNNVGLVTAKDVGTATFTFVESSNGCISDEVIGITVYDTPTINGLEDSDICIGTSTSITPSSGGTWESTDESVATITDDGVITAVGSGTVRFVFTSNATGCKSDLSAPLAVNSGPVIDFTGPTEICEGEQTNILPSSGGQWSSTDVTVAIISSSGVITAMGPGTVSFIYTNNSTGCSSDPSEILTVNDPTGISLNGPSDICIGEATSILPSSGGTWSSSNSSIASISNSGIITGHNPGIVTFTFDSNTGCTSDASALVTVLASPITSFDGPSEICIGSTTNLLPNTGGEWISSDTNVATVSNNGLVTAVGFGTAQFTFTDNNTGCQNNTDETLSVYNKPVPVISGDDEICIGFSTFLTPSTGGVWTSSNTSVAIIASNGQVTGISPGTATFTFYETGSNCVSDPSDPITVLEKAPVSITGDNTICVGETTTASPNTGGSWISDNEEVASITENGVITGITQGIAKFTFISDGGCESNQTSPIIVYGPPSVSISGSDQVCIGEEAQLLPTSGGTWSSSNPSIATITDQGIVTAISSGTVNFIFIDGNTGCASDPSNDLTISPVPNTGLNGPSDICIGSTTFLTPSTGGIWTALDPSIATIQNNGQVSGISPGNARFVFTQLNTGCVSEENNAITVLSGPSTNFTGPSSICIGETTNISSPNAGTWESTNPLIATISNTGLITGISSGSVRFRFTESVSGCKSDLSETLTVNGPPTVSASGNSIVCIDSETTLSPNTGGTWESLTPSVATTTADGIVTGVSEGVAYFMFTDDLTGCESDGTLSITVASELDVQITGDDNVCTGYTTTLQPTTGGTWISNNPAIASVSNFGVVTGKAPGIVTFTFVDSSNGCSAGGTTAPITVNNCINHDFNVALVDQTILGNVSTNDNISSDALYSNITQTLEKPSSSLPQLTIAQDGTYTFVTNKPGKYLYKVPVCLLPMVSGCPGAFLEINVLDDVYGQSNPLSNLEYTTTFAATDNSLAGNTITIDALANDDCVVTAGCELDNSTLTITDLPGNGNAIITSEGLISYTSDAGFIGQDTIQYEICESEGNCSETFQVITVNAPNALNTVVAADDFAYTLTGVSKSGNVMSNDSDPENDDIMVTQQGSLMSPIVISEGSYYINSDGSYEFIPNESFSGALDIIYTVCDDNIDIACTNATLHIQVFDDISLAIRVYLEGSLMNNGNEISKDGRPLMRDGLRVSPFTGLNYIPYLDPYSNSNELYDDTASKFVKMGPGLLPENMVISDPMSVFSVSGDNAIVDWVHVELRDKNDNTATIATRSGLLQRDGDIVDLDGTSALRFKGVNVDSFYVCVRHRTHLGVMSSKVKNGTLVDFTVPTTPTFNFGTTLSNGYDYTELAQKSTVKNGYLALWAGDFNSDGQLKFTEPASDINILYGNVLFTSPEFLINYDFTYGYFRGDYNMDGKAKYANPNDDRNFLQGQIIFHPLNVNYISNLNGAIQQIP